MKQISRKLRSDSGASMILALVFMLFCMFIGGTVLAAASANGYRVAHLSDQQQYLDERSAAFLTAEELRLSDDSVSTHMLIIDDVTQVVQKVIVGNGGVVTPDPSSPAKTFRTITFQAPEGLIMSPFQRIMYETAVLRYIEKNSIDISTVRIELSNFKYDYDGDEDEDDTVDSIAKFWTTGVSGNLTVTGTTDEGGTTFTNFPAYFECQNGATLYDFVVDFGDFSQLSVVLNASLGERAPVEQELIDEWTEVVTTTDESGNVKNSTVTYPARITTTTRMPVIMWENATIVKGGS